MTKLEKRKLERTWPMSLIGSVDHQRWLTLCGPSGSPVAKAGKFWTKQSFALVGLSNMKAHKGEGIISWLFLIRSVRTRVPTSTARSTQPLTSASLHISVPHCSKWSWKPHLHTLSLRSYIHGNASASYSLSSFSSYHLYQQCSNQHPRQPSEVTPVCLHVVRMRVLK